MILKDEIKNVVKTDLKTTKYKLDALGMDKIIHMLSNLYTNKLTFITELISNAWDSHLDAGNTDPIVLNMATDVNNKTYLEIKDWGTGMSPKVIYDVYTVYGVSTKETSKNAIGCYGIGAQAVFAYTNEVRITTVSEGIEYVYYSFLGENGSPEIVELSKTETTKPNQTTVLVYVKQADIYNIHKFVEEKVLYFDNLFMEGSLAKYNNYTLYRFDDYLINPQSRKMHMIVGQVSYNIDWGLLGMSYIDVPQIGLLFDVGELTPMPTRENINYTSEAISIIKKKIEKVQNSIILKYEKGLILDNIDDWLNSTNFQLKISDDYNLYIYKLGNLSKSNINKYIYKKFYDNEINIHRTDFRKRIETVYNNIGDGFRKGNASVRDSSKVLLLDKPKISNRVNQYLSEFTDFDRIVKIQNSSSNIKFTEEEDEIILKELSKYLSKYTLYSSIVVPDDYRRPVKEKTKFTPSVKKITDYSAYSTYINKDYIFDKRVMYHDELNSDHNCVYRLMPDSYSYYHSDNADSLKFLAEQESSISLFDFLNGESEDLKTFVNKIYETNNYEPVCFHIEKWIPDVKSYHMEYTVKRDPIISPMISLLMIKAHAKGWINKTLKDGILSNVDINVKYDYISRISKTYIEGKKSIIEFLIKHNYNVDNK